MIDALIQKYRIRKLDIDITKLSGEDLKKYKEKEFLLRELIEFFESLNKLLCEFKKRDKREEDICDRVRESAVSEDKQLCDTGTMP